MFEEDILTVLNSNFPTTTRSDEHERDYTL